VLEVPIGMAHELVPRGMGAALLTRALAAADVAAGRLVEVAVRELPPLYRGSALARLAREEHLPAAVAEFVAALREEGRAELAP
jgi:DNA-binding transcriptional LysR family regulator